MNNSESEHLTAEHNHAVLKMVIAYDSRAAIARAKDLQFDLARRCHGQVMIEASTWNFLLFCHPELRKQAAREASEANVIVIAAFGSEDLPSHVQDWVQNWLEQTRTKTAALVALLDSEDDLEFDVDLLATLRRMAIAYGVDFFNNAENGRLPCVEGASTKLMPTQSKNNRDSHSGHRQHDAVPNVGVQLPREA